ncbi:hypothetical protein TREMEDRAFT_63030 [Tremella mesenterica DSM 1558]|uniref:uncharacterized protein n=1 Tax=Tremella mesenterica (strain ATCC 24925 / CBS 8224 / DSM 1558 / NBRC 9311 / NRRL Y-6157 / RJB 2259-6 / UBC 559-6) TaxID=578456 RepID=UPI0003F49751|nr:uncharacterized protein TREMEDRAFT_63030 [Tremella mesenterica DSM 1558]EIW68564.1 hypothetical protein TREMEDRAFT_63030 [Tremella mesenterica DSM 1558]
MEENQSPSSPLHRRSQSHTRHGEPSTNPLSHADAEVDRLAPRPGIGTAAQCNSPPQVGPSSWANQPIRDERDPSLNPVSPVLMDSRWTKVPSSRHATPSTHTVQVASSSHLQPQRHPDRPTAPLTTSQPLVRSSSSLRPLLDHTPSMIPSHRKRPRSNSLPNPVIKRRKSRHDTITPSDQVVRTYRQPKRELTRPERLARQIALDHHNRRPGHLVASARPPINIDTLRALDAGEILRHPQLRHDLLFDNLAFRPVTDASFSSTHAEIYSNTRAPTIDVRHASETGDMYWDSIATEIVTGCRCTRWEVPGAVSGQVCSVELLQRRKRVKVCVCGGWMKGLSDTEWKQAAKQWPSRLPTLIKVLRDILHSLMGSTTPCINHFAHSYSQAALEAHEQVCPTVTHALVPELKAALEPDFLTSQVRRGCLGTDLFVLLGNAMKVHCAPVRDLMVDDMVQTATGTDTDKPDVPLALRICFDCLEVMKLDIANHQVHAIRPYLARSAVVADWQAFQHNLRTLGRPISQSTTQTWIRAASQRVLMSSEPSHRLHFLGKCECRNNIDFVIRSLAEGLNELVFSESHLPTFSFWPPPTHSRLLIQGSVPVPTDPTGPTWFPESFKMDQRRIRNFYAEAVDITILQIMLAVFRIALRRTNPLMSKTEMEKEVEELKVEIVRMLDVEFSPTRATLEDVIPDITLRMAMVICRDRHHSFPPGDNSKTSTTIGNTIPDVILQQANSNTTSTTPITPQSNLQGTFGDSEDHVEPQSASLGLGNYFSPLHQVSDQLSDLLKKELQPTSKFFVQKFEDLRRLTALCLTHNMLAYRYNPCDHLFAQRTMCPSAWSSIPDKCDSIPSRPTVSRPAVEDEINDSQRTIIDSTSAGTTNATSSNSNNNMNSEPSIPTFRMLGDSFRYSQNIYRPNSFSRPQQSLTFEKLPPRIRPIEPVPGSKFDNCLSSTSSDSTSHTINNIETPQPIPNLSNLLSLPPTSIVSSPSPVNTTPTSSFPSISSEFETRRNAPSPIDRISLQTTLDNPIYRSKPIPLDPNYPPRIPTSDPETRAKLEALNHQCTEIQNALMASTSFDVVSDEVREFVRRIEKVARFNLEVFGGLYAQKGMVVG